MTGSTPNTLDKVVAEAVGRPLVELTAVEAIDVADRLRAIVTALPAATPADAHLAGQLTEAADLIERSAGIT